MSREEIDAAALQYIRKISGYRESSRANAPAFEAAVAEVSGATKRLLDAVGERAGSASAGSP